MNERQLFALYARGTDVQGALRRLGGDERLYVSCLRMFLDDPTLEQLNQALEAKAYDEAFTAVHALKGLAGNLGFVPLMHATGRLVVLIRGGRMKELGDCTEQVNSAYRDIIDAILENFAAPTLGGERT